MFRNFFWKTSGYFLQDSINFFGVTSKSYFFNFTLSFLKFFLKFLQYFFCISFFLRFLWNSLWDSPEGHNDKKLFLVFLLDNLMVILVEFIQKLFLGFWQSSRRSFCKSPWDSSWGYYWIFFNIPFTAPSGMFPRFSTEILLWLLQKAILRFLW